MKYLILLILLTSCSVQVNYGGEELETPVKLTCYDENGDFKYSETHPYSFTIKIGNKLHNSINFHKCIIEKVKQ